MSKSKLDHFKQSALNTALFLPKQMAKLTQKAQVGLESRLPPWLHGHGLVGAIYTAGHLGVLLRAVVPPNDPMALLHQANAPYAVTCGIFSFAASTTPIAIKKFATRLPEQAREDWAQAAMGGLQLLTSLTVGLWGYFGHQPNMQSLGIGLAISDGLLLTYSALLAQVWKRFGEHIPHRKHHAQSENHTIKTNDRFKKIHEKLGQLYEKRSIVPRVVRRRAMFARAMSVVGPTGMFVGLPKATGHNLIDTALHAAVAMVWTVAMMFQMQTVEKNALHYRANIVNRNLETPKP
jgi:hypothetical protein